MTKVSGNAIYTNSDNTIYSTWCQTVYDLLSGSGLTLTSDTGQTATPVSTTFPASNSTYNVNWVFRFNDTAHSSAPIFFKFEIGRGSGNTFAAMRITVGTGSNGSGTITGVVLSAAGVAGSSWAPSVTNPVRFEANYNTATGCFWMLPDTATTAGATGFIISRTLGTDGVPTADGWVAGAHSNASSITWGSYEVASSITRAPTGIFPLPFAPQPGQSAISSFDGSRLYLYPPLLQVGTSVKQLGGFYGFGKTSMATGSSISINQFGTSRNYKKYNLDGNPPGYWDYGARGGSGALLIAD